MHLRHQVLAYHAPFLMYLLYKQFLKKKERELVADYFLPGIQERNLSKPTHQKVDSSREPNSSSIPSAHPIALKATTIPSSSQQDIVTRS